MIDLINNMALGFSVALSPVNVVYCMVGVVLGTFVGVLPGIGSLAAMSMLLPISFYLTPTAGIVMLAGVYYGAEYGGSTASILLNLPGTSSSAVTTLDGYPMTKKGRAGVALFTTTTASFFGGSIGIILLMALGPAISTLALAFGPAEYFSIMLLGLVAATGLSSGDPVKGLAMTVLGIMVGSVGTDLYSGVDRFTFGNIDLYDGVNIVALAMGLFGLTEIIHSINFPVVRAQAVTLRSMIPTRQDVRDAILPIIRGTGVGAFFGTLPGTGQTIASFVSYSLEKRLSKTPEKFGQGAIEGVAAPEAANNAAVQTEFIPTLTLGIPGGASMALMLGALIVHGVAPGPTFMTNHPDIFWGLIASFWIGNVLLVILNIPMIGVWVRVLRIPYKYLFPVIIALLCMGVYSVNLSVFDISLLSFIGTFGYFMRSWGFEPAPILVGFVLGPMMEDNFRRSLVLGRGNLAFFVERPISAVVLAIAGLLLLWSIRASLKFSVGGR